MIKIVNGDLFTTTDDTLAHCIIADYALGAGIAVQFDKMFNSKSWLKHNNVTLPCIYQDHITTWVI